jgi:DNA mismatch endonuclease (patch repair protein)
VDTLSRKDRSERMARIRGRNTVPEVRVRKIVSALGYRYRLHGQGLPGRPDLVFKSRRKIIFVHGCFWHRHGTATCALARLPKSRQDFWIPKLDGNRKRDRRNLNALRRAGWRALVIWECQLARSAALKRRIEAFLRDDEEVA